MNYQFYSSLIFSRQHFPNAQKVFNPRYNKEYFKRVSKNIDQLERFIKLRSKNFRSHARNANLETLKSDSDQYVALRNKFDKLDVKSPETSPEAANLLGRLEAIEEKIMPIAVALPNRLSRTVPESDTIVDDVKSDFMARQKLAKVLSHTKLSYINNCYSKSVIGPNSYYYFGIGAKLQYALSEFFTCELEKDRFIPVSGLSLVKSAVVEACNSRDLKDYTTDPCRLLSSQPAHTTLHLVETSRESIAGFLATLGRFSSNNPLRLISNGVGYRVGSTWFDSDNKKVTQFSTVHSVSMAPSIEKFSMEEYESVKNIIWSLYKLLELPTRLVHCSLDSMVSNEYEAFRIDVWLPSRQEWIQAARISHFLDYVTIRTGMKRGHIIDSMVYDGQVLVAAIIENRQTSLGKFKIPNVIKEHVIGLTEQESTDYFSEVSDNQSRNTIPAASNVLLNHEQRRYLVKRTYSFAHSEKGKRMVYGRKLTRLSIYGLVVLCYFLDWELIYHSTMPRPCERFIYDFIYRPLRRIYWKMIYPQGVPCPADNCFDELEERLSQQDKQKFMIAQLSPSTAITFGPDKKPGDIDKD